MIGHLGPDLLGETVDADEALRRWAARGATPVAEVLLDQQVVAGIGTIFAAESLFAERIWPWTPADAVADPSRLLARGPPAAAAVGGQRSTAGPGARSAAPAVRPVRHADRGRPGSQAADGAADLLLPRCQAPTRG